MVGDPKQLDPTITGAESAHASGLEQTLFSRLALGGVSPIPLRTQYRCHPNISAVANDLFYEGKLLDGVKVQERAALIPKLAPLMFINVPEGKETRDFDGSYYNNAEVEFVAWLLQSLMDQGVRPEEIGVITLYKAQARRIADSVKGLHIESETVSTTAIQVSTVDAFQGGEKELIILSCVRSTAGGFIDSPKRTNVALTRAKRHMLIVGHLPILIQNSLWGQVIQHCSKAEGDGVVLAKSFRRSWSDELAASTSMQPTPLNDEVEIEYPPTPSGSDAPSLSDDERDAATTTISCGLDNTDGDSDFE